jgi:HK97 family phage portal protein
MALKFRNPFVYKSGRVKHLEEKLVDLEKRVIGNVEINNALMEAMGVGGDSAKITTNNANTLSAVYHAITIHCNSLNIPLTVFKRQPDGDSYPVDESDEYEYQIHYLLHTSPNLMMTPSMWIQLMEMSRLIYGNGYSFINRNGFGEVTALIWIHPDRIEIINNGVELRYNIKAEQGGGYWLKNVRSLDMLHVRNVSFDGFTGKGIIDQARESLEFGLNAQIAGNKFYKSGMRQAFLISHPGSFKPGSDTAARLGANFDSQLKSGKTIIMEEGMTVHTLSFSPEQAQFLTSREFSVTEIARWFNLPESMLENNARSTFSNIEAKFLYFMQQNVRPRARIYEQEYDWKLLGNNPKYYTNYNINAIMRADAAARATYYMTMVQNGIMSRNEIRQLENLNNTEGGDEFLTPMNLTTDSQRKKDMELKEQQLEKAEEPDEPELVGGNGKAKPEDVTAN